jgi:cytochrome c oxidase cbb3-type subunit 3
VIAVAGLVGCEREQRRFSEIAPASARRDPARRSELQPGLPRPPGAAPGTPATGNPYEENAWAVAEGKRLFSAFNCVGCHGHGGGGSGPALIDDRWTYGGDPASLFTSIVAGRPNGMPSFGGKIPEQQVWELVAYVQSLSADLRKDVRPGRADHMHGRRSEQFGPMGSPTPPPRGDALRP